MKTADTLTHAQVLQAAFPAAAGAALNPRPTIASVHVIAQGSVPRWILCGSPSRAVPVLDSWQPYILRSRLQWRAVVAASARGVLAKLPGVLHEQIPIDLSYWRGILPLQPDCTPVIYVGNPSPSRKATLFFVGADTRIKAVAKIPLAQQAGPAILNEADTLAGLAPAAYAPTILFRDRARGIAVQSWLEGAPASRRFTSAHIHLLDSLRVENSTIRISAFRADLTLSLDHIDLPFDRKLLAHACDLLDFDESLPAFVEHGDFAPWNLKVLPTGATGAIDWEWALDHGLPCQDICRFFYMQDALFYGPGKVWRTLKRLPLLLDHYRRHELPDRAFLPLVTHYLLRTIVTSARTGNSFLAQHAFRELADLLHACPAGVSTRFSVPQETVSAATL